MSVQIKIFLGFIESSEIKMHLNQSEVWKEAIVLGNPDLIEIQDRNKEYIGQFLPSLLSCAKLNEKEQEMKSQLQLYCRKLNLDKHRCYLLSQLFIL